MICFLFVPYIFFIHFPFYISIWILRILLIFHVKGLLGSGLYLFAQLCGCVVHVRITIYRFNFSQSTEDNILLFHVEHRSHFHSGPRAFPSVWSVYVGWKHHSVMDAAFIHSTHQEKGLFYSPRYLSFLSLSLHSWSSRLSCYCFSLLEVSCGSSFITGKLEINS